MAVHISIELVNAELSETAVDDLVSTVNLLQGDPEELMAWLGQQVAGDPSWAFLWDVSDTEEEEEEADDANE